MKLHHVLIALAAGLAACGFGDDNAHQGDDEVLYDCGDGGVDPGEDCDDSDASGGDGCSAECDVEGGWTCSGEPSTCTMTTGSCGDSAVSGNENCDDGGTISNDGCSAFCQVESGWECAGAPSTCNRTCGNGTIGFSEGCDDGDTTGGDGCSAVCEIESGWQCTGTPSACTQIPTACGLVPQMGCPGMACDLTAAENGDTACRAVTGNGVSDSFCPVETSCSAGYTCVGDSPSTSYCMRFCVGDTGCAGNSRCLNGLVSDAGTPIPGVTVCTNSCSPMGQTGCPAGLGLGCLAFNATGGDFTDCEVMGIKVDGATCAESTECQAGSLCAGVSGEAAVCRRYCRVNGTNTCASSCLGFVNPLNIAGEELGACD